jgi:uncharacterized protein with HEPN domain
MQLFEIIGEASKKMDQKIKDKYPDLPWEEMYYLRSRIENNASNIRLSTLMRIIRKGFGRRLNVSVEN